MEIAASSFLKASCLLQTRIDYSFPVTLGKKEVRFKVCFEREGENPSTWEVRFF